MPFTGILPASITVHLIVLRRPGLDASPILYESSGDRSGLGGLPLLARGVYHSASRCNHTQVQNRFTSISVN